MSELTNPPVDVITAAGTALLSQADQLEAATQGLVDANRRITELEIAVSCVRTHRDDLIHDLDTANEMLNESADEHDVCSEYEETLADINSHMRRYTWSGRERSFALSFSGVINFSCSTADADEIASDIIQELESRVYLDQGEIVDITQENLDPD